MAVAIRSVSSNSTTVGTSLSVSSPAGSTTGDQLIAILVSWRPSGSVTQPTASGWTSAATGFNFGSSSGKVSVFRKAWASGSASFGITSGDWTAAVVLAVTGADNSGSYSVGTAATASANSPSPLAAPAVTTATGDLLLSILGSHDIHYDYVVNGAPSGMTKGTQVVALDYGDLGGGEVRIVNLDYASSSPSAGSTGTKSWTLDAAASLSALALNVVIPATSTPTEHTASAAVSTTDTITAAANLARVGAASVSTTATVTAVGTRGQFTTAAVSETATITAAANLGLVSSASVAETVTITASADVTPAAGSVTGDAVVSVTDTITAAATLNGGGSASVAETVTITASATVERFASASLSITGALTATATIPGQVASTPGFIRGLELGTATVRPRGGATAPTVAALLSIDAATMTALVSTSASPSRYGDAVFVGGSVDPVTAGLIPSGMAYVWFADDGIHVQGAS